MKTIFRILTMLTVPFFTVFSSAGEKTLDKTTVSKLDLKRYMGKWFEIARFDHRFERGLIGNTAEYKLLSNGTVQVINQGYKEGFKGKPEIAEGKAKLPDPSEPGRLKVSFFLWFYGEYNVLELDSVNYSYALIGSSSDKYLWILSRTPQLPEITKKLLLEKAEKRGYDTSKLIWVKQKQ